MSGQQSGIIYLPYSFARAHWVLIDKSETILHCARTQLGALCEAQAKFSETPEFREISEEEFSKRLNDIYEESSADTSAVEMELDEEDESAASINAEDILDSDNDAPVIRLLNALFLKAVRSEASDIHIETYENRLLVRNRIDGVLRDVLDSRAALAPRLISRIKVMSKLDIAERRIPQDGRIGLRLGQRMIDVRVSTLPSTHGERVVMRLLTRSTEQLDIRNAGMSDRQLTKMIRLLSNPHGILLVTGPTGSGKTTTLYAGLNEIRDGRKNILTIEDPVEFDLMGIGQTPVNVNTGMTFAKGLRAILRQDPDVVMVGEIRDRETAEIAVQASLTGHLVMSTLHTNTAVGAITRLVDMGVEPFLISSSLIGVAAQRLVRTLCHQCKEPFIPDSVLAGRLGIQADQDAQIFKPVGCSECDHSGYLGRTGIFELIQIDDELREMIHQDFDEQKLRKYSLKKEETMFFQGRSLVLEGITSAEELLRVIQEQN